jgi:small subunit ribosomal protein S15
MSAPLAPRFLRLAAALGRRRWQSSSSSSSSPPPLSPPQSTSSSPLSPPQSTSASPPPPPPPSSAPPPRSPRDVPEAAARRIAGFFYDPALSLSRRQRTVFARAEDEPPLPAPEAHGFLYGLTAADMEGRNELVRRALSTRTADSEGLRRFARAGTVRRFQMDHLDTGSGRVQVAALTERISRLSSHLDGHKKDTHSKRTLLVLSSRRRRVLEYMQRRDYQNYRLVARELALRPLPVFNSKHTPKVRAATHGQIIARNARIKNRSSRGDKGH